MMEIDKVSPTGERKGDIYQRIKLLETQVDELMLTPIDRKPMSWAAAVSSVLITLIVIGCPCAVIGLFVWAVMT